MKESITPLSEINGLLTDLSAAMQTVLQRHFVGMYLYGSLALGDFDPGTSDIDMMVITDGELPASDVAGLERMHARFGESGSPWASRLEVVYIPTNALQIDVAPTALFPQVEKDREWGLYPVESGWVIQLFTLREHGLVVAGPDPTSLIAPIAPDDVRRASAAHAVTWAEQARSDPKWLIWIRNREHQTFVVMTLCRMLYSLRTGTVASKPGAARWMAEVSGTRWAELVRGGVTGRRGNGVASDREAEETIALIDFVAQQYLEWCSGRRNRSRSL
jgi:hypothetical protein